MVPVVRNAERMSLGRDRSARIKELAIKARDGKLSIDEMTGGTFTITNGGVFGSMLSTPIINPPQSAILGMHNIVERPVAVNGQVVIRPVMYVALSYDHRIIDGKESVSFLYKVKEMIEDPNKLVFGGKDPGRCYWDCSPTGGPWTLPSGPSELRPPRPQGEPLRIDHGRCETRNDHVLSAGALSASFVLELHGTNQDLRIVHSVVSGSA
jgi:hypothetical protein